MKKITVSRMLSVALIGATVGFFGSCKDNEDDLYANLHGQIVDRDASLNEVLNQQKALLENLKEQLENVQDEDYFKKAMEEYLNSLGEDGALSDYIQGQIGDYKIGDKTLVTIIKDIDLALEEIDSKFGDYATKKELADAILDVNNQIIVINTEIASIKESLDNAVQKIGANEEAIKKLDTTVAELSETVGIMDTKLNDVIRDAAELKVAVEQNADRIEFLKDSLDTAHTEAIEALRTEANEKWQEAMDLAQEAKDLVAELYSNQEIDDKLSALEEAYKEADEKLSERIGELEGEVATLKEKVDEIEALLTNLQNTLAQLVTGIIVQATENPVFGSFSLPFDIRSNVLLAYAGSSLYTREFPTMKTGTESNYDINNMLTAEDLKRLKAAGLQVDAFGAGDELYDKNEEGNVNAGKMYLTVNPNTVDFEGMKVSLENSQATPSGVQLGALKHSNKKLTFGVVRANNAFYEADAYINPADIASVKINIQPGLKSALKDALDEIVNSFDKNNITAPKIEYTKLISLIYKQFNGILDANALSATYEDGEGKAHSVYSEYNVAAAAFKPLSFKFMEGYQLGKLPTINPFSDITLVEPIEFDLNLKPIEITLGDEDKFEIHFDKAQIDYTGNIQVFVDQPKLDENGNIVKDENGKVVYEKVPFNVDADDLADFIQSIEDSFNDQVDGWDEMVNDELNAQVAQIVKKIQDQVNTIVDDINGQLGQVNDLVDQINGVNDKVNDYIHKANNYVERLNTAINRINGFLNNANHYLQPTMMYEVNATSDALHQLSNNKLVGTPMVAGSSVALYPTTYTAELIVPVYEKFVAVTNVYEGMESVATDEMIRELNSAEGLNEVVKGTTRAVAFTVPDKAEYKGKTIELVYSALDYSGVSSTRKFYIYVK